MTNGSGLVRDIGLLVIDGVGGESFLFFFEIVEAGVRSNTSSMIKISKNIGRSATYKFI